MRKLAIAGMLLLAFAPSVASAVTAPAIFNITVPLQLTNLVNTATVQCKLSTTAGPFTSPSAFATAWDSGYNFAPQQTVASPQTSIQVTLSLATGQPIPKSVICELYGQVYTSPPSAAGGLSQFYNGDARAMAQPRSTAYASPFVYVSVP